MSKVNPMHVPEIVQSVARYCDGDTLLHLQQVCTMYKDAVEVAEKREPIWRDVCKRDIPSKWLEQITQKHYPKRNYDRFEYPKEYWKSIYVNWYNWNHIGDCDFQIEECRLVSGGIKVLHAWGNMLFVANNCQFTVASTKGRVYRLEPVSHDALYMKFIVSSSPTTYEEDMNQMFNGVEIHSERHARILPFNMKLQNRNRYYYGRDFWEKYEFFKPVFMEQVESTHPVQSKYSSHIFDKERIFAWHDVYFQICCNHTMLVIHVDNKQVYLRPGVDIPNIVSVFMYAGTLIVGTTCGFLYVYKVKEKKDLEELKLNKWDCRIKLPTGDSVHHIDALCMQDVGTLSFVVSTFNNIYIVKGTFRV